MGLFDTFHGEFECHYCGKIVGFEEQTKRYDCTLSNFSLGDYIDKANANHYYGFDYWCPKCGKPNQILLKIKNGRYEEVINVTEFSEDELKKLKNDLYINPDLKEKLIEFGKSAGRVKVLELFDQILREI